MELANEPDFFEGNSAIAAGSTCVLKPSEISPLSAYVFSEIMHDAGVPAGVYNMLNGDGVGVGSQMSSHKDIDMISFYRLYTSRSAYF